MKSLFTISMVVFFGFTSYSQSVGINEDASAPNPSAMLDVKSTTKGMLVPRMTSAERTGILNPGEGLLVYDNETASFWYYKAAGWTELVSGGVAGTNYWDTDGTHIYNNNTGNVGIGTNFPTTKLTILTPINTSGWTHIGQSNGTDSIIVGEGIGGVSAAIGTSSQHALRLTAGTLGRVQIYPGGEVVIGDNNVGSVGRLTVKTTNNADGISHIGDNGNILKTIMGGTSAGIGTFSNTNMRIFSNSNSAIFIAAATGNVGIGTNNPTYKLSVLGNIRSTEVVVETGWADYVFDKNYQLKPLYEVEAFIQQNNHLPNIPTAAEIEKNGLHLGDTQKRMMEKIEELTLYLIQQQKEIDTLKKKLKKNN